MPKLALPIASVLFTLNCFFPFFFPFGLRKGFFLFCIYKLQTFYFPFLSWLWILKLGRVRKQIWLESKVTSNEQQENKKKNNKNKNQNNLSHFQVKPLFRKPSILWKILCTVLLKEKDHAVTWQE